MAEYVYNNGLVNPNECSICLEEFKSQKLLPCFHKFCVSCLEDYIKKTSKNGKFECPTCRSCSSVPCDGVGSFADSMAQVSKHSFQGQPVGEQSFVEPSSEEPSFSRDVKLYVRPRQQSIGKQSVAEPSCGTDVDVERYARPKHLSIGEQSFDKDVEPTVRRKNVTSVVSCDVCGEGELATHRCCNCSEHFCSLCSSVHSKMKATRLHRLVELEQANAKEMTSLSVYCLSHPSEKRRLFCEQCNTIICIFCKIEHHDTHPSKDLQVKANEVREALRMATSTGPVHEISKSLQEGVAETELTMRGQKTEMETVIQQLKNQANVMHKAVDIVVDNLEQELKQHFRFRMRQLQKSRTKNKKEMETLSNFLQSIDISTREYNDIQIIQGGPQILKELQQLVQGLCVDQTRFEISVEFIPGKPLSPELKKMIGEVKSAEDKGRYYPTSVSANNSGSVRLSQPVSVQLPSNTENIKERCMAALPYDFSAELNLRVADILTEETRKCLQCSHTFSIGVSEATIEAHMLTHVKRICPFCQKIANDDMDDDEFLKHVNGHMS